MEKMVLTCAVSGAETTKEQNCNLPVSPEEIADAACEARLAGASILHLHVRDRDGKPTQSGEVFRDTIERIRKKCDIVIEVSTGGAVGMSPEERLSPVFLGPEMASLDCGTVNFGDEYLVNTVPEIRRFAEAMREYGVQPTLECFDLSHVYTALKLIDEGLIRPPYHFGFVLGVPGGIPYSARNLGICRELVPPGAYWTVIGIGGRASVPSIFGALSQGGFVRQGFEDNIYFNKGELAVSNAQLIERAAAISRSAGYETADPAYVRKLFNLKER